MTLHNIPTPILEAELERRRVKPQATKPMPLEKIDWQPVQKLCQSYIDDMAGDGYVDEDLVQYIFESAMQAVFGPDVWTWTNAQ